MQNRIDHPRYGAHNNFHKIKYLIEYPGRISDKSKALPYFGAS